MMRTVRHPITMFVVAVLAVVGIGVGLVAATTHQKVYGPPSGRFTAAFPGRVYESRQQTGLLLPVSYIFTTSRLSRVGSAANREMLLSPAGLAGVTVLTPAPGNFDADFAATQRGLRSFKVAFFSQGASESVQGANGFMVTTVGPQCDPNGECREAQLVTNGRALWELVAFFRSPDSTVEDFIASFQPIG